jgi:hypothetical protein
MTGELSVSLSVLKVGFLAVWRRVLLLFGRQLREE